VILLDTNIISDVWKPQRSLHVERWIDAQPTATLFVSTITLAELNSGACRLPEGRRKDVLLKAIDELATQMFAQRVLPFDQRCAHAFGRLRAERERIGRPIIFADAAIAATAWTHGLRLATRNQRDYEGIGLDLVNPFDT
jgi:toxin FitB